MTTLGFLDPTATRYVQDVVDRLRGVLGSRLVGAYLHGSGTLGDFLPGRSDIDLTVVSARPLAREITERVARELWTLPRPRGVKGLDLHVVPAAGAARPSASPAFSLQVLTFHRVTLHAGLDHPGDPRLLMHFAACRSHGYALAGPPPREVFGTVPRRWFLAELLAELDRMRDASPGYRVLAACRNWRYLETGEITSKREGAEWARSLLADPAVLDQALEWRHDSRRRVDPVAAGAVVARVSAMLRAAVAGRLPGPPLDADAVACHGEDGPLEHLGPPVETPLVSCLMPVGVPGGTLRAAVDDFLAQDYPNRELVVLDGSRAGIGALLPSDPAIRVVRVSEAPSSLDRAIEAAYGHFLAMWSDRTRHEPWRLGYQMGRMMQTGRRISGPVAVPGWPESAPAPGHLAAAGTCWVRGATLTFTPGEPRLGGLPGWAAPGEPAYELGCPHLVTAPAQPTVRTLPERPRAARAMVSCLMPTYNRLRFVRRAVRLFLAQDHPARELIVVDDGPEPVADLLPANDDRIRYIRLDARATIGAKRNIAGEAARGDIVMQWDDDDWYGPTRITDQIAPIAAGRAELTGIEQSWLLDLRTVAFWQRDPGNPPLAGGTLTVTRDAWAGAGGYPDVSVGEDVGLLHRVVDRGARIARVLNNGTYVYVRHTANSWRFEFTVDGGPPGWSHRDRPDWVPVADVAEYQALR